LYALYARDGTPEDELVEALTPGARALPPALHARLPGTAAFLPFLLKLFHDRLPGTAACLLKLVAGLPVVVRIPCCDTLDPPVCG
jgi:hypothetical protein